MRLPRYNKIFSHPDFFKKEWVIQGTGKSFRILDHSKYNIISVNDAAMLQPCFIAFVTDRITVERLDINVLRNTPAIVTRIINADLFTDFNNVYGVEYDIDVIENKRYYKKYDITPVQNSTSFAVMMLGQAGIDKFYTNGVDGGTGKADSFIDYNGECYDRHMQGMMYWAEHYTMQWLRL
jgi:hypothetical protein